MIVKNEEDTLERCLSSAKSVVDEIVIVDTGSEDRTREIAARFTDDPPEGMTPKLVRNMTDSDLLDMHYFLIEDDDLDDDEFEEEFYIF